MKYINISHKIKKLYRLTEINRNTINDLKNWKVVSPVNSIVNKRYEIILYTGEVLPSFDRVDV